MAFILGGVEGVSDVETDYEEGTVTITFDDERTKARKCIEVLEKNRYTVDHEPRFLE